jgi:hypothetical protein
LFVTIDREGSALISRWRRVGRLLGICTLALAMMCVPAAADDGGPTVTVDAPINASTTSNSSVETTISDGTLLIRGTATDEDGISHLTIAREYEYHDDEDDGRSAEVDRYYATPDASNGTFEHRVPLGIGTNEVNLSVVDGAGIPSKLDVVVHVQDDEPPVAEHLEATQDGEWIRLTGTVRDNVQVAEVRAGGQTLQTQTGTRDLDREGVRLDHRIPHPSEGNVTVVLVDTAGNSRKVAVPIGSTETATPTETAAPTSTATATPTATTTPELNATTAATTAVASTPTDTPAASGGGGGWGLGRIVATVVVLGGGLLLVSTITGGGW